MGKPKERNRKPIFPKPGEIGLFIPLIGVVPSGYVIYIC